MAEEHLLPIDPEATAQPPQVVEEEPLAVDAPPLTVNSPEEDAFPAVSPPQDEAGAPFPQDEAGAPPPEEEKKEPVVDPEEPGRFIPPPPLGEEPIESFETLPVGEAAERLHNIQQRHLQNMTPHVTVEEIAKQARKRAEFLEKSDKMWNPWQKRILWDVPRGIGNGPGAVVDSLAELFSTGHADLPSGITHIFGEPDTGYGHLAQGISQFVITAYTGRRLFGLGPRT